MFVDTSISIPSAGTVPASPGTNSAQTSSALFDASSAPFAHLLQNSLQQDQQIQHAQEQQDEIGNFEAPRTTTSSAAKPASHSSGHPHVRAQERSASGPAHAIEGTQPVSANTSAAAPDSVEPSIWRAGNSQAKETSAENGDSVTSAQDSPQAPARSAGDSSSSAAGSAGSATAAASATPAQAATLPVADPSAASAASANSSSAGLISAASSDAIGDAANASATGAQPQPATTPLQNGANAGGKTAPTSAAQQARVALTMPQWLFAKGTLDGAGAAQQGPGSGNAAAGDSPAAAHNVLSSANANSPSPQGQPNAAGGAAHAPTFATLLQQMAGLNGASTAITGSVPHVITWTSSPALHDASNPSLGSTAAQNAQTNASFTPEPSLAPPADSSAASVPADSASTNTGSGDDAAGDSDPGFGSHSSNSGPATSGGSAISSIAETASTAAEIPTFTQAASMAMGAPSGDGAVSAASGAVAGHVPSSGEAAPSSVLAQHSADGAELSAGLQAWNGGDNAQARLVQSAELGKHADHAEMSIALQADKLGAVQLHAQVAGDQVGASIAVERHDAHAALTSELPSLHQALADRQLTAQNVTLLHGLLSSGANSDSGGNAAPQQQNSAPRQPAPTPWTAEQGAGASDLAHFTEETGTSAIFDSYGRLSVRA